MKEQKIVTAAIKKARKNGYKLPEAYENIFDELEHGYCRMTELWWEGKGYYGIIFSYEFAIAFWGREPCIMLHRTVEECEGELWMYELQMMVVEMAVQEDKAKYLKRFL